MANYVAHFNVTENDETITRRGKLMKYDRLEGYFTVKIDGQIKRFNMDQLNTIKYQRWQDDSQEELF